MLITSPAEAAILFPSWIAMDATRCLLRWLSVKMMAVAFYRYRQSQADGKLCCPILTIIQGRIRGMSVCSGVDSLSHYSGAPATRSLHCS